MIATAIRTTALTLACSGTDACPPIAPEVLATDAPDAHLTVIDSGQRVAARASVWWRQTPRALPDSTGRAGFIGHFAATDAQSSRSVLDAACSMLRQQGCAVAVGPIDGSTWRHYRFVIDRGSEPSFFLEPDHPHTWPGYFTGAGFEVFSTYRSSLVESLDPVDCRVREARRRYAARGIHIRTMDATRRDDEIGRVHQLCCRSFAGNHLYTPLSDAAFRAQQDRLWPFVDPELVLLAEVGETLVGFAFALPDRRSPGAGTIVVKTLAVLPGAAQRGLGAVLVDDVHARARQRGYTRAIHALMHDRNSSRNISRRYGRTFRRYALFARRLEAVNEHR